MRGWTLGNVERSESIIQTRLNQKRDGSLNFQRQSLNVELLETYGALQWLGGSSADGVVSAQSRFRCLIRTPPEALGFLEIVARKARVHSSCWREVVFWGM